MGLCGAQQVVLWLAVVTRSLASLDSSRDEKAKLSWIKPGILTHQSLHSVLVSMEEKLRGLENMKYTVNRMDMYLQNFARKLDSLDVRTRAVQIKLEQLEAVSQTMISQEMKNDLSFSHLQRKYETNQDRLIHKISLTENRLDSSITKFQSTIDIGFENIEKKQNENQNRLSSLAAGLEEISARVLKIEDHTNSTACPLHSNKVASTEESRHNHINRISDMLQGIEKHVNRSLILSEQSDGPNKQDNKIKQIISTQFHSEANKIANKINNMYNELWIKTSAIENLIKEVAFISNRTEENVGESPSKMEDIKCSETIQSVMREMLGTLGSSLQEKLDNVDTNVEGVFATHKMILGAYNKMREDENQFETKLTFVLGKILETIENRTTSVNESQRKTLEALQSHNSQIVRTIAYNTNFLKKIAEDTGVEHKNVETALVQLASSLNPEKHESQEYDDTMSVTFNGSRQEGKETRDEPLSGGGQSSTVRSRSISVDPKVENHTRTDIDRQPKDRPEEDHLNNRRVPQTPFQEEKSITNFDDSHYNDNRSVSYRLDDEKDKAVTKLLMLYLKALKGHLSKDRFLYEADPQQPYSSVQEMIRKLKEKNFPSDFLKELDEWDHETNDKEALEENTEEAKDFESHSEDYFPDRDYLDYPS